MGAPRRREQGFDAEELARYPGDGTDGLQRPVDEEARPVPLPVEGVVLTRMLGDILELEVGDRVLVDCGAREGEV